MCCCGKMGRRHGPGTGHYDATARQLPTTASCAQEVVRTVLLKPARQQLSPQVFMVNCACFIQSGLYLVVRVLWVGTEGGASRGEERAREGVDWWYWMDAVERVLRRAFFRAGYRVRAHGQALWKAGLNLQGALANTEGLVRHKKVLTWEGASPEIGSNVFVAPNASVIGKVTLGDGASVWYGATLRGDVNSIAVGAGSCVLDNAVVHVAKYGVGKQELPTIIGDRVCIGSGAIVHACEIASDSCVGNRAIVMDGATVAKHAMVGAGSMVTPGTKVGEMELWQGSPAKFVRNLTAAEVEELILKRVELSSSLALGHMEENLKTLEEIDDEKYKIKLRARYTKDYLSHIGLLGMEEEMHQRACETRNRELAQQRNALNN
ncbi:Gamma carbonic anhydrase 2, mitochondrial [Porphyridium purpureum]|uniref:Gamma carbonic anhydrase 2, mitochondrial n=1 Tax=Porphyridium purpureum TaxID=35688 RepID=A0A5J4Z9B7_PORPP|nr:Gamma carbonic anhydrase 2, mitochondrial [Porphyridium purpureum]|eukprot:POR1218..scf295_1